MHTRQGGLVAVAALGLSLGLALPAGAADNLIPGKITIVKDAKLFKVVAKPETTFTLPTPGGTSDPTVNATSLSVIDTGGAGTLTDALTGGAWEGIGNPAGAKGYKYKNTGAPASGAVKVIILKASVIKILAKDDGTLDGPIAGEVGITLNTGDDRYCASFGGTDVKNDAGNVKRKDAPAPSVCPTGGGGGQVCGNGMTEAPETCDDGNTVDGDFCPANCIVATCGNPADPMSPRFNVDVTVNASLGVGQNLGTVRVFLNYPESLVIIPGSADDSQVQGSVSMTPAGANCIPNDVDYGLIQGCLSFSGYPAGQFTRVGFVDCDGSAPVAGDFQCTVLEATDQLGANVSATCSVSLP